MRDVIGGLFGMRWFWYGDFLGLAGRRWRMQRGRGF